MLVDITAIQFSNLTQKASRVNKVCKIPDCATIRNSGVATTLVVLLAFWLSEYAQDEVVVTNPALDMCKLSYDSKNLPYRVNYVRL